MLQASQALNRPRTCLKSGQVCKQLTFFYANLAGSVSNVMGSGVQAKGAYESRRISGKSNEGCSL